MSSIEGMDPSNFQSVAPSETAGKTLVLIETASHWFLAPKLDPELEPGVRFLYNERMWTVIWDSDQGFGEHPISLIH